MYITSLSSRENSYDFDWLFKSLYETTDYMFRYIRICSDDITPDLYAKLCKNSVVSIEGKTSTIDIEKVFTDETFAVIWNDRMSDGVFEVLGVTSSPSKVAYIMNNLENIMKDLDLLDEYNSKSSDYVVKRTKIY